MKKKKKLMELMLCEEATNLYRDKIVKRCLLEGCRYSFTPNEEEQNFCVYCYSSRPEKRFWYGKGIMEEMLKEEKKRAKKKID